MLGVIIWIVIIIVIINVKRKNKEQGQQNPSRVHTYTTTEQTPVQQAPPARQMPPAQQALPAAPAKTTPAKPVTVQREEGQSVTEYLHEKAMQDEAEHRKEKMREAMKERKYHGFINTAQRLYPGDPIPPNMRVSICPYCAAENLIPARDESKYHCYFCRHEL